MKNKTDIEISNWLPLTVFKEFFGEDNQIEIEINNPINKNKLGVSKEAALELIFSNTENNTKLVKLYNEMRNSGFIDNELDEKTIQNIEHWMNRNWFPSINTYLFSRKWDFDDNGPDFEEIRDKYLIKFLEESGEPPLRKVTNGRKLDAPVSLSKETFGDILLRRSSSYSTKNSEIDQKELSAVLSKGLEYIRINDTEHADDKPNYDYLVGLDRVFDVYIAVFNVTGLKPGIYYYDTRNDLIEIVREGNFREEVRSCLIGQEASITSGACIFLSTDFYRVQWTYRHERVIRNIYINSGRIMQSLILLATSFGMKTSITPAIKDSQCLKLLNLDDTESQVLYSLSLS